ncbi:DUF3592 domain-containing protein [Streptomyces carpinensis]|uniref:DUF3592 domain-containing protein n=1 Tax=Streptomyces carpinensis TaxID=66369 RepID=A0ABV1VXL9_9ACTN|nr:DUF3592 domain-containing protein [Streptomyces carpinensis]
MDERKSLLSGDPDEYGSPFGWRALAVVLAFVVWMAFGPFGPVWLYLLGWAVALAAADGIYRLVRHRGWAMPSPGRLVAGLLRLGPESWLVAPRWAKVRLIGGGFLMFATFAGFMGWGAGQEYQALANLRDHGRRIDATVVEITSRSEEGWATSVTVYFGTPSGPVRADVDIVPSSADDAKPGVNIPVVYNPARPTEVRHVTYLDGHEADGILQGAIVAGLLAAGFLVGTTREVLRTKRQTGPDEVPGTHRPGA